LAQQLPQAANDVSTCGLFITASSSVDLPFLQQNNRKLNNTSDGDFMMRTNTLVSPG